MIWAKNTVSGLTQKFQADKLKWYVAVIENIHLLKSLLNMEIKLNLKSIFRLHLPSSSSKMTSCASLWRKSESPASNSRFSSWTEADVPSSSSLSEDEPDEFSGSVFSIRESVCSSRSVMASFQGLEIEKVIFTLVLIYNIPLSDYHKLTLFQVLCVNIETQIWNKSGRSKREKLFITTFLTILF